jgi:hypothetical protein
MKSTKEIDTQRSLVNIVQRLPYYLQTRWRKDAVNSLQFTGQYPDIDILVRFVTRAAKEANDPVFGAIASNSSSKAKDSDPT